MLLDRRRFIGYSLAAGSIGMSGCSPPERQQSQGESAHAGNGAVPPFELEEATIASLQDGMRSGQYSARRITELYLDRISALDRQGPSLHSVIETNPEALQIADALDAERKARGPRGLLHGIPILIKDNIDTADKMTTTAGSLALTGSIPLQDSFVAKKLREAGAVVLGKANLSEWANIRSNKSSSGWSGRGGQCRNPYVLDRNPSGSSSGPGAATSANLTAVSIGTETDGSIISPSSTCGIVGIKPTVGLISRAGVIPISHSQDTSGPMCRTVTDAAILLGGLTGIDPRDAATNASRGKAVPDYTQFLDPNGLKGMRIGVSRSDFGFNPRVDKLMSEAMDVLKKGGAEIIDPANIDSLKLLGDSEMTVLLYELKAGLNAYLVSLGPKAPIKTLKEVIEFNEKNADRELLYFGQELFLEAEAKGPLTDAPYLEALKSCQTLARLQGIDAVMGKNNLDAIVAPANGPAWITDYLNGDHFNGGSSTAAAIAGYPSITVPCGFVGGLPIGISFFGRAWSEPVLIKIAFAFEQAAKHRRPPRFFPNSDAVVTS
jgi:amidase